MKKQHVIMTVAALLLAAPPLSAYADGAVLGFGRIKPSLVQIWTFDANKNPVGAGTGLVVASDSTSSILLTAAHVVDGAASITVDVDSTIHDIPAIKLQSGGRDLALLKMRHGGLTPATLSPRVPPLGEEVAVVAFPGVRERFSLGARLSLGPISAYEYNGEVIEISDADIQKGMSGGALVDPNTGDVFGIIDAQRANAPGGFAVSTPKAILSFLKAQNITVALGSATVQAPSQTEGIAKPVKGDGDQNAMQQAFFQENYSSAATLAGDYLLRHPDDNLANGVMVSTIRALFLTQNETQAVGAAKQYLVSHPHDTMATVVVASSLRVTSPDAAIQKFASVESIPYEFRPYAVEAYYHAAQQHVKSGDTAGAISRLRTAMEFGGSPDVRSLLSSLAPDLSPATAPLANAPQKALQEYNNEIVEQLGDGHQEEAAQLAADAHRLYPGDGSIPFELFTSYINHAKSLESVGKWRDAIDTLEHSAKLVEPVSTVYAIRLWVSAGDLLQGNEAKRSDIDEAVTIRDHTLQLDPDNGLANLYAAILERYHLHDITAAKRNLLVAKAHEADNNEANQDIINQQMHELGLAK